jgi:pimeloyl-ACP methyl ester carboxylesterase
VIVFVHGVPETAAVWSRIRTAIGTESVALSLPGFGCPRPLDFGATLDEYVIWVVEQLDQLTEPVHLVGHDGGALLTYRIAMAYGDRLRSWVADTANVAHPDYVWHRLAQIWQAPGTGEAELERQLSMPTDVRARRYAAFHLAPQDARELAAGIDKAMASSILALYRSALPNINHLWGPLSPTSAPGLVVHPSRDSFSDEAQARDVAAALGARFTTIDANHFWPYEVPHAAARILTAFWASIG